jgi:hypothetical protein
MHKVPMQTLRYGCSGVDLLQLSSRSDVLGGQHLQNKIQPAYIENAEAVVF